MQDHNDLRNIDHGRLVFCCWEASDSRFWPLSYVSPSIQDVLGYRAADFLEGRLTFGTLLHPSDRERRRAELRAAVQDQFCFYSASHFRVRDINGRYHFFDVNQKLQRDENGELIRIHSYLYDESEVEQQKVRLQLVLESSGMGMWDWNPETDAVVFDENWTTMLGYSLAEIEPSMAALEARMHPDDIKQFFKSIRSHVYGAVPRFEHVYRMQSKQGDWLWLLGRGRVVEWDSRGNPVRFTGTQTDITTFKRNEQLLQSNRG